MSVKIINVLKDDSFNDILELFQKTSAVEVILVLPRVGKLFRHEDHFAAFASEAQQGGKVVSVLTANPQTALLARKFGFTVMASGASKTAKKTATLARSAIPTDFSIPDMDDGADLGDVPLTSDQTQGSDPQESNDDEPLRNMRILDDEGNRVDEDGDGLADEPKESDLTVGDDADLIGSSGARAVATLAAAPKAGARRVPKASDVDGVRIGAPARTLTPASKSERAAPVPVQRGLSSEDAALAAGSDYIDTVWRGMKAKDATHSTEPSLFRRATRSATSGSAPKRMAGMILLAAIIVLAGVVYLMTGKARVALTPTSSAVDTEISVQASDAVSAIDDAFGKIPGQLVEVTKTTEHTVAATGKRDVASKARGKITVYNEYSSSPQALVTNTRFGTSDGKIFRTLQSVTVPGSSTNAGKTVAGKITVDVIADAPGTEYNVPAGRFIIVAFKEKGDTNKVQTFYGISDAPMSGGASGPSVIVTQADYDAAKTAAIQLAKDQVATAITAQGADFMVLNADAPVISDVTSSALVDNPASEVKVTVTATLKTIAFRTADLHELIARTMLKKDRQVVLVDQHKLTYTDITFKSDLGTLAFTVGITGKGYAPIDIDAIRRDIAGKSSVGVRDFFHNREGVESATVTLSPFWVRSVPAKTSKIDIQVVYPTSTP